MIIKVNGEAIEIDGGTVAEAFPDKVVIMDGYQLDGEYRLVGGESLIVIAHGEMPDLHQLEKMMVARHSPDVHNAVKSAHVAVLGLGGLGSNVATMLARLGVGSLTIVDYDRVEPSNLNRQSYYIEDIGKLKCVALSEQIKKINPYINVSAINVRVTQANILEIVNGANIVVEAFDRAETKAMAVNMILENTNAKVVCASGMAGYGEANAISTRAVGKRLIVCGDGVTDSRIGIGLMSPRVTICAAHQANAVLRLIMGLEP